MNDIIIIASIIFGVICLIIVALTSNDSPVHYGAWGDTDTEYKYNYEDAGDFD